MVCIGLCKCVCVCVCVSEDVWYLVWFVYVLSTRGAMNIGWTLYYSILFCIISRMHQLWHSNGLDEKTSLVQWYFDKTFGKILLKNYSYFFVITVIIIGLKRLKNITVLFLQDLANLVSPNTVPKPPITFRLIVPASQCGSLIGN